ncbi:hypothetical protein YUWDRAFT_02924 [Streptomyces sp. AmelKG-D3]|nr:hypothetical protein YUWDRAFT_02924 [Streptomyces sp. AmelKG-D3]
MGEEPGSRGLAPSGAARAVRYGAGGRGHTLDG